MFIIDNSSDERWYGAITWAPAINFCVWVLEQDGLLVFPFVHHLNKNGRLQELGMTSRMWEAWLLKVVTSLDIRLTWCVEDIQAEIENRLRQERQRNEEFLRTYATYLEQSFSGALEVENQVGTENLYGIGLDPWNEENRKTAEEILSFYSNGRANEQTNSYENRTRIEQELLWKNHQYQAAVSAACEIFDSSILDLHTKSPVELWHDEQEVKELLGQLWEEYQHSSISNQHAEQGAACIKQSSSQVWEQIAPYCRRVGTLCLYSVAYPAPVNYLISPTAAIMTMTSESLDIETLTIRVRNLVQELS